MYDPTGEAAVRELAEDRMAAQISVSQEEVVVIPAWLMETLANVAREWPHVFDMALPDRVRFAYGRRATEVAAAYLTPFFETD